MIEWPIIRLSANILRYARGRHDAGVEPTRQPVATGEAAREFRSGYELAPDGGFLLRSGELSINVENAQRAAAQPTSDLHSAIGMVIGSPDEAMASFEPQTEDNPAYIAVVFYSLLAAPDELPD